MQTQIASQVVVTKYDEVTQRKEIEQLVVEVIPYGLNRGESKLIFKRVRSILVLDKTTSTWVEAHELDEKENKPSVHSFFECDYRNISMAMKMLAAM